MEPEVELDQLEHLNLVSRVITELENHFGISERDVAEFIIELAKSSTTFDKFKKSLEQHGLAEGVAGNNVPFKFNANI